MRVFDKRPTLLIGIFVAVVVGEFFLLEGTIGISLPGGRTSARSTVSIRLKGKGDHYVTDNKRFIVVDDYDFWLVLRESVWTDRQFGVEGADSKVTVEAFDGDNLSRLKWKLQEPGDRGEVYDTFYKLTKWGCCGSPNKYTYYSLRDGKRLYSATVEDLFWVFGSARPTNAENGTSEPRIRYISYEDNPLLEPDGKLAGFTGVLRFGSDRRVIREIEIHSPRGLGPQGLTVLSNGKRYLPGTPPEMSGEQNGDVITTFEVSLRFVDGTELRLPVEQDDINLRDLKIPTGYKLIART